MLFCVKLPLRRLRRKPIHTYAKIRGMIQKIGQQHFHHQLVCEHLALETVAQELGIAAARNRIYRFSGRTFLEVQRFDHHGSIIWAFASLHLV